MGDMEDIVDRIKKIKEELAKLQQDLTEMYVYGEEENKLVKSVVTGKGKIVDYKFTGEKINNELKKAIIEATNNGLQKANKLEQNKKQEIVGDVDIPDMPGLF